MTLLGLNPVDSDWWWQYALDGIAGGVLGGAIGGLVAWYAVGKTIQHERRLQKRSERKAERIEMRRAAGDVAAFLLAYRFDTPADDAPTRDWTRWVTELYRETRRLENHVRHREVGLAEDLDKWASRLMSDSFLPNDVGLDRAQIQQLARFIDLRARLWLRNPKSGELEMASEIEETASRPCGG